MEQEKHFTNERSITDYLDNEVKEYAISVVEERAIPSIVDGFKPVQRKIAFTANKLAKSYIKTAALVGNVISVGGYYKGDASISAAVGCMTQDFAGSNNFPFLSGEGEFGKRLTPDGIAPARYTKSKIHSNFAKFFGDSELLEYVEQDGELFEPRFYLPTIPTVLLNGVAGIAVGFATKIQPYNVKDIIENTKRALTGKALKEMIPYHDGFAGTISKDADGSIIMRGIWRRVNSSTIEIVELPVGMSRDKYVEHLNKLEDRGDIKSYDDLCKKEFKFIVYLKREDLAKWEEEGKVEQKFKLTQKLSENINLISEKGKLIYFESANDVIKHFVDFRLGVMTKRKEHFQTYYAEKNDHNRLKIAFIKAVLNTKIDFKKALTKDGLRQATAAMLAKMNPSAESIERLLGMPVYSMNEEEISNIESKIVENQTQIEYYKNTSESDLFVKDISDLSSALRRS